MRGFRRVRFCLAASRLTRSTATAAILTLTVVVGAGGEAALAQTAELVANGAASDDKAADQQVGGDHEPEWPSRPRTFAQPAFKPDFRAMTAAIEAEPPPAAASPEPANPTTITPLPALRVTQPADTAPATATAKSRLRLEPSWPRTLPEAKGPDAKVNVDGNSRTHGDPADVYTPQEIAAAKAHCTAVLQGVDAVAVPENPIRQGNCGTPAPMQLMSIGRGAQQVTLNPPAIVTCDMVVAMANWVKTELQPSARRHLGSPLVRIDTMSSYSCRTAYGRKRANLSEHGRANAIDIRSFVTAAQAESDVLAHWGPTARDVKAQVAAAKAAADKAAQEQAVAAARIPSRGPASGGAGSNDGQGVAGVVGGAVGTMMGSVPELAARLPGAKAGSALGLTQPSRLGGPKEVEKPAGQAPAVRQPGSAAPAKSATGASTQPNTIGRTQFLRDAHASACRIFGTVLGPEANHEHRNHFHVDMADRPNGSHFCE
jgi:hypothetical protein